MSNINFSQNLFSLNLGNAANPVSVLGLTSSILNFNHDYEYIITVKRFSDISLKCFINQSAAITWATENQQRFLHGVVVKVNDNQSPGVLVDQIIVHSPLCLLNLTLQSAVYADMDVVQLITTVLAQAGWQNNIDFQFHCRQQYPMRQYIAQYQETALMFIQRQCAVWGIMFSFVQKEKHPLLLFTDDILTFSQQFVSAALSLKCITVKRQLLTKTVILNDYNPDEPSLSLVMQQDSAITVPSHGVDYRPYEHYLNKNEGQFFLQIRSEALDCHRERFMATTNDVSLQVGQMIQTRHHGSFHIIEIKHHAEINSTHIPHNHYFTLTLLRASLPYRPKPPVLFNMPDCPAVITSEHVDDEGHYLMAPLFDQRQLSNHYPARLSQPYAGNAAGFHFPLQKGNTVLISHINGDPDRPVIMGVIPDESSTSPVTLLNNTQKIMQTPLGNQMVFDDQENQQQILLSTPGQEITTRLNANQGIQVCLTSQKNMALQAIKDIQQNTNAFFIQTVSHDYVVEITNQHQIATQRGDITLQSGKDLQMMAGKKSQIAGQQNFNLLAEQLIQLQAQQMLTISANQINLNTHQDVNVQADKLYIQSQDKIIISQNGCSIIFEASNITINAKQVNFNTKQLFALPIQIASKNSKGSSESIKQTNLQLVFHNEFGELLTEQNLSGTYSLLDSGGNNIWIGGLLPALSHFNITQQNLTLDHPNLAIIAANKQQRSPANHFLLTRGAIETQDDVEIQHIQLQTIHRPVYKIISPVSSGSYLHVCEAITADELKYFKQNGNNVTIFIHGYNVPDGQYPGSEVICNIDGTLETEGDPWYFNRTLEDIQQSLGASSSDILQKLQQENDQSDDFDEPVNGIGAHNWLLHMEYNLNCAAAGNYPFPWTQQSLSFSRLLFIRWAGDVGNNAFEKALNFGGAELNALAAANALVPVIHQLSDSGISINLIAHSLGNLTLIKLMDVLGRQSECLFDTVVMWQPAIAKTALSTVITNDMERRVKNASSATLSVNSDLTLVAANDMAAITGALASAGLSIYGDYLKVQGARINDPNHSCSLEELFDKDPFAYFPFAHQSAKKINVLYSANDDVLKFAYMPQDVTTNLSQWGFIHEAMGLVGPDKKTQIDLKNQLNVIDQKDWLQSHSDMRIPSQALFENIYKKYVVNAEQGINKFGRYHF